MSPSAAAAAAAVGNRDIHTEQQGSRRRKAYLKCAKGCVISHTTRPRDAAVRNCDGVVSVDNFGGRYRRKRKKSIQDEIEHYGRLHREKVRECFVWRNIIKPDPKDVKKKRRWEEMDHDILVNIMKRLSWREWNLVIPSLCKSWLLAALDVFFPSPNALDLRRHDVSFANLYSCERMMFYIYLKLVLDSRRPTQLFYPNTAMPSPIHSFIAQRLPSLQRFELAINWAVGRSPLVMVEHLATHCKKIHTLCLFGYISDAEASLIAENFHQLKHLEIPNCILSIDALSIILDGHKSLITLNTQHCYCLDDKDVIHLQIHTLNSGGRHRAVMVLAHTSAKAKEWKEEEILQKAAAIKRHLQCARKNCSRCFYLY